METKKYENISETLVSEKLKNGLTIKIIPRRGFSKAYAMFATDYGGADRRFKLAGQWIDTPAGVAHFLEHKMFDMPYGNALNVLSANGASPNAFTSSGMTAYHFECTDLFYENLKILLEFVSTPFFTAESVQKEQGIIGQEIRMVEDSPDFVVYNRLLRCLYETNPVRDSVAGTVESIAEITHETLYNCHKVFYNPSNMALSVVGDVDPERVIKMAEELLPEQPGEVPERDYGKEESPLPRTGEVSANMEVSAPQFLTGASIVPEKKGPDRLRQMLVGEIALRLLLGRSSPVYTGLYSRGLLNGSFEYELDYTAGTAMLLCGGESRDVPAVMAEIRSYADRLASGGIDPYVFENTRRAYYGTALRSTDSFAALAQAQISGVFGGYSPLDSFEFIEDIDAESVRRFIAENLTAEKLALSVVNPIS